MQRFTTGSHQAVCAFDSVEGGDFEIGEPPAPPDPENCIIMCSLVNTYFTFRIIIRESKQKPARLLRHDYIRRVVPGREARVRPGCDSYDSGRSRPPGLY